jgi:transposase-like protein
MQKIKRVRRSEAMWRELFSRQEASGLRVSEFCRRERINAGLFRRWRATLKGSRRAGEPRQLPPKGTAAAAPFIDLGALGGTGARFEVRLELGDGMALSLVRG